MSPPSAATGWAALTVAALTLLVTAAGPGAEASSVEALAGSLEFRSAVLSGRTEAATSGLGALHLSPDEGLPLDAAWSLEAREAIVNWSRVAWLGAGSSPNDPNRSLTTVGPPEVSSGEDRWSGPGAEAMFDARDGNLLLVTRGASLEMVSGGDVGVQPSTGEAWAAGRFSDESVGAGPDVRLLTKTYPTTPGEPVVRAPGPTEAVVRGDFTLYVWGSNVTVRGRDGTAITYPNGAWYENATATEIAGPRGVSRTEYWQLLRIDLIGATLRLEPREGVVQWTAGPMETTTEGLVRFQGARGRLASASYVYDLEDEAVEVRGAVSQTVRAADGGLRTLQSDVVASRAEVSVPPLARAEGTSAAAWPAGSGLPAGILAAAVLAAGTALGVRHVRDRMAWSVLYRKAEEALRAHRYGEAARRSNRLVRRRPEAVEAWVLWGESQRLRRGPRAIVGPLERAVGRVDWPAPVQFLLALAHLEAGNEERARACVRSLVRDRAFLRALRGDPLMRDLEARTGVRTSPEAEAAYA